MEYVNSDVELLEQSVAHLTPRAQAFAARFYEVLLVDHPDIKPLFHGVSMAEQQEKLWSALALTVQTLRDPLQLAASLRQLGKRHEAYGVQPEHYKAVQRTLLVVLEEFLGQTWTHEVDLAWAHALEQISQTMLEGSRDSASSMTSPA